jgi:aarF domain-containing kinase
MASGWTKVAAGARLVITAVAKQTAEEASVAAQRVTLHGLDLSSKARQTVAASSEAFQRRHPANGIPSQNYSNFDQNQEDESMHDDGTANGETNHPQRKNTINGKSTMNGASNNAATTSSSSSRASVAKAIPNPYLVHADPPESTIDGSSPESSSSADKEASHKEQFSSATSTAAPDELQLQRQQQQQQEQQDASRLKEGRAVPSSRVGRAFGFASLGVGLALGTATEFASSLLGNSSSSSGNNNNNGVVTNDANADRLAATLCRMRGAALKMGQMLSIQDESLLPPALTRALKQVRQGADAMPEYQLRRQLESQLGTDWRDKFESFEMLPFAAASIGQVHRATIREDDEEDGGGAIRDVVVKVQYPGVAQSIESDLRNLTMLITMTGLTPKGLFLDNVVRVGRDELKEECNYLNEMANQQMFQTLVEKDPILRDNKFVVPRVFEKLTTEQVIVSEYAPGGTIDKVSFLDQDERNRIGRTILYLTMKELFVWRVMQTDPNWGNFLYDVGTNQTTLIDFGATREYSKSFVDGYLRIVWASANRDEIPLMEQSHRMGFLTGEENEIMLNAHKLSGFTVGEPFWADEPFDFQASRISSRMSEHSSVFLKYRLT